MANTTADSRVAWATEKPQGEGETFFFFGGVC